jgi:hypothetical protein
VPVPEIDLRHIRKWCTQETSPLTLDARLSSDASDVGAGSEGGKEMTSGKA